ncbi:MAG: class I SAM-dependent methyltransferase [Fimbriimonadaceae bacterium]|nr:class I SAM-dependent methyltransferase [Fimbriimonadaceae bacterium]
MKFPYKLLRRRPDHHYVPTIYGRTAGKMRDIRDDAVFKRLADRVMLTEPRRTLLYYDRLHTLYQAFLNARDLAEDGPHMAEIGVFRGGGSAFLASLCAEFGRDRASLVAIDTFEGHAAADLPEGVEAAHETGTFDETAYEDVRGYLAPYLFVEVVQGRVQDRTDCIDRHDYGLVHLDVDIYLPMIFGLRHFGPRMLPGGIIVCDDHGFVTCPGVPKAVDEFLAESQRRFTRLNLMTGQCVLIAGTTAP